MDKKYYHSVLVLAFIMACFAGYKAAAQTAEKTPYYIDLNTADGARVHEISDKTLSLQYFDSYGKWKEIPLKIYDWKRNLVATLSLDKAYGLNSFVIKLEDIYSDWHLNEVYVCELRDESNRKYELPVKLIPMPDRPAPSVDILVNPLEMKCDGISPNVVEFYGQIEGGKAPYIVDWYIVNDARTEFLYQPREEIIKTAGKTMVITVDKKPDYYVMLYVKDACGAVQQKAVNLVCQDKRKKINTIFVESESPSLIRKVRGN